MKVVLTLLCLIYSFESIAAFTSSHQVVRDSALSMAAESNDDLLRWAKSSRSAGSEDNVVELMRPLGVVLNQDDKGNVFVEAVAPKGNAARTGKVGTGQENSVIHLTSFLIKILKF